MLVRMCYLLIGFVGVMQICLGLLFIGLFVGL